MPEGRGWDVKCGNSISTSLGWDFGGGRLGIVSYIFLGGDRGVGKLYFTFCKVLVGGVKVT